MTSAHDDLPAASAPGDIALIAHDVSKVFATGRSTVHALRDVDLTVERGTFVSLIGPSGCGKSTFLRILSGLEDASSGDVWAVHDGRRTRTDAVRSAFVFQDHTLFPWLTVVDNIAFGLRMSGVPTRRRRQDAHEWLDRLGLLGFGDAYPEQLSGGMRQRIGLARAFVTDPDLLYMDEPMGAVDAQTRLLLQEDLIRLWEEAHKTVLLVTHSLEEALLLGDRVVVMTARPGHITLDLTVDLPRPRTMDVTATPRFGELKARLWAVLRDEVARSLEYS